MKSYREIWDAYHPDYTSEGDYSCKIGFSSMRVALAAAYKGGWKDARGRFSYIVDNDVVLP